MVRTTALTLRRWRILEEDAYRRYRDYLDYRRGRHDGRCGHQLAGTGQAYLAGFALGQRDRARRNSSN